ncbi:MAG TPA: hypothetical protein VFG30_43960 [Polyangiales bacterium]|jgi:hypothetical protein|nr:hypothetical protein [Polyangiales bacterium]
MKSWMFACMTVGLLGFANVSCDSEDNPIEDADEAIDCSDICGKYKDCFDSDYDTDKCESKCEDRADDPDHLDQEEKCSDCIDNASCGESVFSCATDCVGIVP